jgi:hypothetical protein
VLFAFAFLVVVVVVWVIHHMVCWIQMFPVCDLMEESLQYQYHMYPVYNEPVDDCYHPLLANFVCSVLRVMVARAGAVVNVPVRLHL